MVDVSKEIIEKIYEAIEIARTTGKIRKGSNEATKAIEKGEAKLIALANDVSPAEVIMHIPLICKEKGILCITVGPKVELGAAAGLEIGTTAIAIVEPGDAKGIVKSIIEELGEKVKPKEKVEEEKEEKKEEKKEEVKKEIEKEEKKPEVKEESLEKKPAEEIKKE